MKKVKKNIIDNINLELENYKPNNFPETFDLVIYYYFLAIYYKKTDLNKYRQYLEYSKDQLNKILNNLKKYDIPLGSWYGFTGIAYMIRELYGECQILYSIENFVKDQSLKLIVNGKNHDLFNGKYDLLNGLTGILSYFITYHNEQLNYIEECLNWMIKLFEEDCEIIKSKNIWIKNKYITNPIFKKKYSEGYIDLGAAHGIIDFLYIFSLAKKNNIKCNKLDEIFIDDSYLNFINNCIGCKTCFKTGNCIYDNKDGIIEIKNKLLGADIIVISTPIFIDNISGNLKTLFDRLSYWFHTMPLKGKKCILIISTYRTGINEVSNYLYKICSYLGLEVVGLITSDYKTTKNVLCNEIDISLDYLETGLLKKCTNVAYSDYIYNLR